MTDIIERLKYFSGWSAREVPGVELSPVSTLCWDAIDEIERLRNPAQGKQEPSAEDIARTICLSYGRDPDEMTSMLEMCDAANRPVAAWRVYEEQADAILAAYPRALALPQSTERGEVA